LECPADFTALNFQVSEYRDLTGRTLRAFDITKDGFTVKPAARRKKTRQLG
jgi:hypothetical protein